MRAGAEQPMVGVAAAIFDLSRGRQALLSVAQPALAAIAALGRLPAPHTIVLGLIAASTGYLAVFSLNDVLDRKVDTLALAAGKAEVEGYDIDTAFLRHPLARGDLTLAMSVAWVGGLGVTSAVCAWLLSPACVALFAAAVALEMLYCALRSVTWAKTFVSGAMVGVGGLAGWVAVAPLSSRALPVFGFLALWEIAGRNLPNDLSDIVADSATNIRTVATVFGERTSARSIVAGSVATALVVLALPLPLAVVAVSAILTAWAMLAPSLTLLRNPTPAQAGAFFNRASLLPALVLVAVFGGLLVAR